MSGEVNWKMKYQELKSKYMNAVDMAFRLGVEEGMKQGQLDNAQQQLAQSQEQNVAAAGGAAPGQPGGKPNNNGAVGTPDQGAGPDKSGAPSVQPAPVEGAQPAAMAESEHPEGSELDQHISKLESMIAKSETPNEDLQKSLEELKILSQSLKFQAELKKSAMAIPAIARALHKPQFKFGVNAAHNLNSTAKASVSLHHQIVNDVFKSWEKEEQKAVPDILSTLSVEGITKGE